VSAGYCHFGFVSGACLSVCPSRVCLSVRAICLLLRARPRVICLHAARSARTIIDWRHYSLAKWYRAPVISQYAALKWEYYGIVLTVYPAQSWAPRVRAHEFRLSLSVRQSVCPSVTRVIKTAERIIEILSRPNRTIILVFSSPRVVA